MSTCSYVLKKGKNKGQFCGIKCSNNKQLCKKHSVDDEETLTRTLDDSINSDIISSNKQQNDISNVSSIENLEENEQLTEEKVPKEKEKEKEKKVKESKDKKEKEPKLPKEKKIKEPKEKVPKEKKVKEKKNEEPKETSIKVQVYNKIKPIAKRNSHGNYVLENNLVVHPVNKKIIGRQKEDQVVNISIEDIEYCKENGFLYDQPSVLYFLNPEFEKRENELTKYFIKNKNNEDNEILDENLDENSENSDSEINSENDME